MKIIAKSQILQLIEKLDLIPAIEEGFAAYSSKQANIPPVGELILPKGEIHIKYGALAEDDFYVIKIASGFYQNRDLGLPSGNGLMLLFSQQTGELKSILLDEGHLTDIRTAVAGAIAAKYLAPRNVSRIGIVGTGIQGRQQLIQLKNVTNCRNVLAWGKYREELAPYKKEMEECGFQVEMTQDESRILKDCNLVVTCTPSREPLLSAHDLRPGTHITAVGSDTPEKQELDSKILGMADLVVADSIDQCMLRGEIFQALKVGAIEKESIVELGNIIAGRSPGRTHDRQVTVADLTGVAVQDIKIASAVYQASGA